MSDFELNDVNGPHAGIRIHIHGNTKDPQQAIILLHGRGSSGPNIMRVTNHISAPRNTIFLAPSAQGNSWYPARFFMPQTQNEPELSSSLAVIHALLGHCEKEYDIAPRDIALAGFSQGACLTSEFASRHNGRLKGLCIWSGGLIGSDNEVHTEKKGNLEETPAYIGCDEADMHIPLERVQSTTKILKDSGADVTCEIYQDLGHAIHENGYRFLSDLLN